MDGGGGEVPLLCQTWPDPDMGRSVVVLLRSALLLTGTQAERVSVVEYIPMFVYNFVLFVYCHNLFVPSIIKCQMNMNSISCNMILYNVYILYTALVSNTLFECTQYICKIHAECVKM